MIRRVRWRQAAVMASTALLLGAAAALAEDAPEPAAADQSPGVNARYLLMDSSGQAVSDQDFPGRYQLIAFGYTSCPDICPTTLAQMALVLDKLGDRADRLQPIFISVDPERDTPKVLRAYTAYFSPRILGLTGSPDLIRGAADRFHVKYEKVREPGAPPQRYTIDHSVGMYLLGPDGRYLRKFAYAVLPADIASRIRQLMEADAPSAQH